MREFIVNGKRCFSKNAVHSHLMKQLDLAEYYGKNLDALWDLLMEISYPTKITLINSDRLSLYLGDYGVKLYHILEDAAIENENITFLADSQL